MDFARLWTGDAESSTPSYDDDIGVLGGQQMPALQPSEDDFFIVIDANWDAVDVFLGCRTQWRIGLNGREGLDYAAAMIVMQAYGITNTGDCLRRVTVIEHEALSVWDQRRAA